MTLCWSKQWCHLYLSSRDSSHWHHSNVLNVQRFLWMRKRELPLNTMSTNLNHKFCYHVLSILPKPWGARWGPTPLIRWGWLCRWQAAGFSENIFWVLHLAEVWRWRLTGWLRCSAEVGAHTGPEEPAAEAAVWKIDNEFVKLMHRVIVWGRDARVTNVIDETWI